MVLGIVGLFINGMSAAMLTDLLGINGRINRLACGAVICGLLELIGSVFRG